MDSIAAAPTRSSRRAGSAPTISDVAKRAGVSPMTVSRVINGEANVRPATRDAVNAAISALNYAPNRAARSLAGAGQVRIGLLYSNPSAGFLSEFLLGSLDQASRSDVQIVVERCELGEHELEVAQHLVRGGIDGIILPPPLCEAPALLSLLRSARIPTVAVATGVPAENQLAIRIDDREAAAMMTRHIMELGHRRIGFIAGNPNLSASAQRLEGFREALAAAGMAEDPALIVDGLFTYRSGLDAAEQLLDLAEPPTAIFSSNDDMAAATVAIAHRRGLDVPGDLTVCGFDDTTLATAIWPELTTIHQPIADMARAAVELLVATLRQQKHLDGAAEQQVLDFTLIRRQSDAPPRRRPRALGA
ncbi:LacI family DNA-binding transcriptional regulator [Sphingomonas desiccabilis]|uniref:LacI family DNA-binding transcriptional regulator n=1 Tax=Sphingomonas desiccabilis TaxID=429134 RepID=A0A4Q2IYG0_9SPHN|nr:LacI family DNA-binding transcriptional regulator [Sphingomonas desiccabilis]RXZ35546.1 LacI family DNA-binding transcriptional regulator [Sphingomonas desiccabilis]